MANELPKRFFDKGNLATLWTKFKTWLIAYVTRLEKKHFPDDTDNITVRKSVPANADFGNDNTTYGQGTGITIDYQNNIHNAGVRSISAGSSAGALTVDTNGRLETVTVPHCSSVVNNITAGTNVGSINITKNGDTTSIAVIPSDAKLTDTTYSAGDGISISSDNKISSTSMSLIPPGTVLAFMGASNKIPSGWFLCDGSLKSKTTYANLHNAIGNLYGESGNYFRLPKLTDNRFLEGSSSAGSKLDAGLPEITGSFRSENNSSSTVSGAFEIWTADINEGTWEHNKKYNNGRNNMGFRASKSNSIYGNSTTVQPLALTCLYIIKY